MKKIAWLAVLIAFSSTGLIAQDIFEAVRADSAARLKSLLDADPGLASLKDDMGRTPLQIAALYGYADVADALIRSGADINTKDKFGKTPLRNALQSEESEVVRRLVSAGAEIAVAGEEGRDTLHRAARTGCRELLELMARKGADLRSMNDDGGTFLHSVARGRLTDWTTRLLEAGFDPNARDRYSLTPLHLAARGGFDEGLRILLDRGADKEARTVEGKTAYHLALENGQAGTAALLRAGGADTDEPKFPVLRGDYFGQKTPGPVAEPFAVGIVSTMDWEHGGPVFSPNGSEMYWSPVVYGASRGGIMVSRRVDDRWTRPVPASFTKMEYREMGPGLSADGSRIYFTSYRPIDDGRKNDRTYGLWYADRTDGGWGDPRPLPPPINAGPATVRPALARGDVLYFSSRSAELNSISIFRSPFDKGRWAEPELLPINGRSPQVPSFASPDDRFLIFESARPGGFGGYDLYVAFRNDDGTWSEPVNLGARVNTAAQEWFASMSHDGKYLFFTSNRNGNDDVYWIDVRAVEALKGRGADSKASGFPVLKGPYLGQAPPGDAPEPFAPGIVSGPAAGLPSFSATGEEAIWPRKDDQGARLYFSRMRDGIWTRPRSAPVSGDFNDAYPAYSRDGRRLYFASQRPLERGKPAAGWSIWVADREGERWASPRALGSPINILNENSPSLTDKEELVFASNRPGGLGKFDIYRSALRDGRYGEPGNLGRAVNSEDQDVHPWIAPDGSYLLFASLGRSDSFGGADLYVSFKKEDGSWEKAVNLGRTVNSAGDEYYGRASPDGKYLFFTSNRKGRAEVLWISIRAVEGLSLKALRQAAQE